MNKEYCRHNWESLNTRVGYDLLSMRDSLDIIHVECCKCEITTWLARAQWNGSIRDSGVEMLYRIISGGGKLYRLPIGFEIPRGFVVAYEPPIPAKTWALKRFSDLP